MEQALTLSPFAKLTKGIQNLGASLGPKNEASSPQQEGQDPQLLQEQWEKQQQQQQPEEPQETDEYKLRVASSQSRTKFVLL